MLIFIRSYATDAKHYEYVSSPEYNTIQQLMWYIPTTVTEYSTKYFYTPYSRLKYDAIRYDREFNVDSKAEYSA